MSKICSLTNLKIDQKAKVIDIASSGIIRRRLQDIGLIKGTCIKCVLKSPANDPIAYEIRGAIIAIRNEDSSNILVSLLD